MQRERKIRALRTSLGWEKIKKGDEYVFTCCRCLHRKPKLSVNVERDHFHCWVCNFRGPNLAPLLKGPDKDAYVEELKESRADNGPVQDEYDDPELPREFRTLSRDWGSPYHSAAMSYLKERGITREDILRWKLGYCEEGEYKNRIIVPSFDELGQLNFFVGRTFYDNPVKYKSGNFCKDIIWNDYMVDWDSPVVVTEGPFDAFKVKDNVIALQGNILHEDSKLFFKIVTSNVDVYMAMDADAVRKQLNIIQKFLMYGIDCYFVPTGTRKDVGEMSPDEFKSALVSSIPIRDEFSLLRIRVNS